MPAKSRHPGLTIYLSFLVVGNAVAAFALLMSATSLQNPLKMPPWYFPMAAALYAMNVIFAVGLFRWKRWGFAGFVFTAFMGSILNLAAGIIGGQAIGMVLLQVVGGLLSIGLLYAVLQMGTTNKGWNQLE